MSAVVQIRPGEVPGSLDRGASKPDRVRTALLALGIVGPLFYVASDVLLATRWEGYSSLHQTVSELFAIGAPTRPLAVVLMVAYGALAIAFGVGVWQSADGKFALRVVGGGLIGKEMLGIVATAIIPIHVRGMEGTLSDTLHGALTFAGALCYLLAMGFAATTLGKRFRLYSIVTMLVLVAFGMLAGLEIPGIATNQPTPWVGLWERIDIYATLAWIAALAVGLLLTRGQSARDGLDGSGAPDRSTRRSTPIG
jgi:hypothetical protein